jgi:hypothetical protein
MTSPYNSVICEHRDIDCTNSIIRMPAACRLGPATVDRGEVGDQPGYLVCDLSEWIYSVVAIMLFPNV